MSKQQTITGYQTKGDPVHNAELESKPVSIKKRMAIKSVSGNNDGFWIHDNNGNTVYEFWKPNDTSAIGRILEPNTYCAYPALAPGNNEASIIIKLQECCDPC